VRVDSGVLIIGVVGLGEVDVEVDVDVVEVLGSVVEVVVGGRPFSVLNQI